MRLWDMHNRTAEPVVLRGMPPQSGRSRSAAMGTGWPVAVGTRPCGCGTCTTQEPVVLRGMSEGPVGGRVQQ